MGFHDRVKKTDETLRLFESYLNRNDIEYSYSGYELNPVMSPGFKSKLREMSDHTSNAIRYYPDMIICRKQSWLIEIKNSNSIERDAYNVYMDLKSIGFNVGIVNYHDKKLIFTPIRGLVIMRAYPNKLPVRDNKWYYPRDLPENEYWAWKKERGGSGTPFGYIDWVVTEKNSNYLDTEIINSARSFESRTPDLF